MLGLLISGNVQLFTPILTFKCLAHSAKQERLFAESTLTFTNDNISKILGNTIFELNVVT